MSLHELRRRAELARLARTLGADLDEVQALVGDQDPEVIRLVRDRVSDHLLDRSRDSFQRVVALAERIPSGLAVKVAEQVLGPADGARAAALLSPEKAAELASRASPAYVADIARNADLRHISELLDGIPQDTIVNAATELARSGDHVVLGGFASAIADGALEAVLASLDSSALLETGFYLEDLAEIDRTTRLTSDQKLEDLLLCAAHQDRADDLAVQFELLGIDQRRRVAAAIDRFAPDPALSRQMTRLAAIAPPG